MRADRGSPSARTGPARRGAGIIANDGGGEEKMNKPDEEVRDTEQDSVVSEGTRYRQGDAELRPSQRASRAERRPSSTSVRAGRHHAKDAPTPPPEGQQIDEQSARTPPPARPSARRTVTWVMANTKVRSKKSSSGVTWMLVVFELAVGIGHAPTLAQVRPTPRSAAARALSVRIRSRRAKG